METNQPSDYSVLKRMLMIPGKGVSLALNGLGNRRARRILDHRVAAGASAVTGRLVVYTSIFGGKDKLIEPPPFPNVEFVCFTDDPKLTSQGWRVVTAPADGDPRKSAKMYKILPHRYFPEHDYSLWVDGTHVPAVDPRYLVHTYLRTADLALFAHHCRACIYDEMQACMMYGKGDAEAIARQESAYRREGYPAQNGLATCTVILRNHNSIPVKRAMEQWWEEINRYSVRDQFSFNYVVHRNTITYAVIPGNVYRNHLFHVEEHRHPDRSELSIGWALNGSEETASARFMGYNMHRYLASTGVRSKILFRPGVRYSASIHLEAEQIDEMLRHNINVLVLVKIEFGRALNYLILRCRQLGIKLVYAACDFPLSRKLAEKADGVLVPSSEFVRFVRPRRRTKVHLVFDGYEHDGSLRKVHHSDRRLKLCLVTNRIWDKVPCLQNLPKGVTLKVIGPNSEIRNSLFPGSRVFRDSPFDVEYVDWHPETVLREILECDAGIVPWPEIDNRVRVKSANRLILFMSLGIPVVASPVPSYTEIVRDGENSLLAHSPEDWQKHISALRDAPVLRLRMGETARSDVVPRFSLEKQGEAYRDALTRILRS